MEQKVKSTLDNLYRMVNSPEFDPDAFVFTIHSLQKLVQDSIYALSSGFVLLYSTIFCFFFVLFLFCFVLFILL